MTLESEIYLLPTVLYEKVINSSKISHYFENIPDHCFKNMFTNIIFAIINNDFSPISDKIILLHRKLNISKEDFQEFIQLVRETLGDLQMNERKVIKHFINFENLIIKENTLVSSDLHKKINEIKDKLTIMETEYISNTIHNDVDDYIKNKIDIMKNSLSVIESFIVNNT
jgi:hypothetical protein